MEQLPSQPTCPPEADTLAIRRQTLVQYSNELVPQMVSDSGGVYQLLEAMLVGDTDDAAGTLVTMWDKAAMVIARRHPVEFARFVK